MEPKPEEDLIKEPVKEDDKKKKGGKKPAPIKTEKKKVVEKKEPETPLESPLLFDIYEPK